MIIKKDFTFYRDFWGFTKGGANFMYVTQDIADRIKWRLKEKGIRTKDMLSDLDMGINAISEFAKGKQMSCIALARIADYLDCSVDYLLGRTDNPAVNR